MSARRRPDGSAAAQGVREGVQQPASQGMGQHSCPMPACREFVPLGGLCDPHAAQLRAALLAAPEVLAELAEGSVWSQRSGSVRVHRSKSAERGLPYSEPRADAARNLAGILAAWAADVCGLTPPPDGRSLQVHAPRAAEALVEVLADLRRHPAVADLADELVAAVCRAQGLTESGRSATIPLGLCDCTAPLRVHPEQVFARCYACGAVHRVRDRQVDLLDLAADRLVSLREAASLLSSWTDEAVKLERLRQWANRGKIAPVQPSEGPRSAALYRLGDVAAVLVDMTTDGSASEAR